MIDPICTTCGARFPRMERPPHQCPICTDDRQYVPAQGQTWTTAVELSTGHQNQLTSIADGLTAVQTVPSFAIGQRAIVVQTAAGNILWDCISFVDDDTVDAINEMGGLDAIAVSHPHFYTGMAAWSAAFGDILMYIHADDRKWVQTPTTQIKPWHGRHFKPLPEITLIHCGGHFPGSAVLHRPTGIDGRGVLLTGDTIQPVAREKTVTFMYSYPNQIPLNETAVRVVAAAVEPFAFDALYGAWPDAAIPTDAKTAVQRSAERYIEHIRPAE